ncbi:MAG TPA: pilus assembly protein HicB [Nocardioidaceae bacterium]|jgi:hypothetical protein|nr:pilus assembly protein HicB [Marmoricola sp.]HET8717822.1 pilus assembly protein HicB [Nocardioidaceae bacterium]
MDITPYVEGLRHDLAVAAEAGGDDARAVAERLLLALDPAVRLTVMDALSQAAAEITSELPAGSVDVRLKGREPEFVVDVPTMPLQAATGHAAPAPPTPPGPEQPPEPDEVEEDDTVARITLRIPESVKYKAEELAAKSGHSLNSWLVNVIRTATRERAAVNVDVDLSSIPFLEGFGPGRSTRSGKRMSGWV